MKFKFCAIALFLALVMLSSGILLKYDYAGIRTQKIVNGVTTNYFVEGSRILGEETNGVLTWYYYDESGVSGMKFGGVDYIFEKNILGDIVGIYNASTKAHMGTYTYDAWGNTYVYGTYTAVLDANPFRYRGYYWDIQTGLYYLQSRYYDSRTGRFLNADDPTMLYETAGIVGGANLYAYCLNNPISYTDPTGESILLGIIIGVLVTGAVVGSAVGGYVALKNGYEPWSAEFWQYSIAGMFFGVAAGGALLMLPYVGAGLAVLGGAQLSATATAAIGTLAIWGSVTMFVGSALALTTLGIPYEVDGRFKNIKESKNNDSIGLLNSHNLWSQKRLTGIQLLYGGQL